MGVYMEAFQHFVWATYQREELITVEIEPTLYTYIRQRCKTLRVKVHALNGMPDHVHLAVTLPATVAPADFMHIIKGASGHFVNHLPETDYCLHWQDGYGCLTFASDGLPRVTRYIDCQKAHHAAGRLSPKMERAADWEGPRKNS